MKPLPYLYKGYNTSGNPDGNKLASVDVDHDDIETTGLKTATFANPVALLGSTTILHCI